MALAGLLVGTDRSVRAQSPSRRAGLHTIVRSDSAPVGLVARAVAHGVMVSVMTMTPLHYRTLGIARAVVASALLAVLVGRRSIAAEPGAAPAGV